MGQDTASVMDGRRGWRSDEMLLVFAGWLCTLPLVTILIMPWLGWQATLMAAAVLLVVALLACWGACGWKLAARPPNGKNQE
jgi:hypothetical protein